MRTNKSKLCVSFSPIGFLLFILNFDPIQLTSPHSREILELEHPCA